MWAEPREKSENLLSNWKESKHDDIGLVLWEWDHLDGTQSPSSLPPLTDKETETQTCPKPGSWLLAQSGKVLAFA